MTIAIETSGPGLQPVRSRTDRLAQALEQGLRIPWRGVRPDLVLHKGARTMGDKETYVLEDPVRGTHYELGEAEARFFLCLVTEPDLRAAVNRLLRTTALRPAIPDILSFVQMLQVEKLAILPAETAMAAAEQRENRKPPLWKRILTGYLFIQFPLLRPQGILDALYPWLRFLWSRPFLFLYAVLGVVGLVFSIQQAELYLHAAARLFTLRGALLFFASLSVVKTLHEFGHAFAARHQGLFVRRMGFALMVFMPILYTDVTDAWKLPTRRGRVLVGAAGILTEICIAAISLFFWSVLPDGPLRAIMFHFSGASILSTILVNMNPLMRFDGYYILMDWLRISNLRTRGTQMYHYYRRRFLVDWRGPKPEEHPWEGGLAWFGFFSMIYRIMIFLSITLMIYHLFFKALGAVLVALQILTMILLPLIVETIYLIRHRDKWGSRPRVGISGLALVLLAGAVFLPFPAVDRLPALVLYRDVVHLRAPRPGRLETALPEIGARVERGDLLVRIRDIFLERELKETAFDLAQVEESLKTIAAGGEQGGYRRWLLAERDRLEASLERTRRSLAELEVRAPASGRVLDVNPQLGAGAYVGRRSFLLAVGDERAAEVQAFAPENVYRNLLASPPDRAHIVFPNLETPAVTGLFQEMRPFPVDQLPNEALFDYAGGDIPARPAGYNRVRPADARYPVLFAVAAPPAGLPHGVPGYARISGARVSLAGRGTRWLWRTLAAEGFV